MTPKLRDYQEQAIQSTRDSIIKGHKNILVVAPTGAGKTTIAAELILRSISKGSRIWFLAHREELISQCSARLDVWGVDHGVIQGRRHARFNPYAKVQVASVLTAVNRLRGLKRQVELGVPSGNFKLPNILIIDEAHRSTASTYEESVNIINELNGNKLVVLGLTATPCRLNGKPLGMFYNNLIVVSQPGDLIEHVKGPFLMEPEIYCPTVPTYLEQVSISAGDYKANELEVHVNAPKLVGDAVKHHKEIVGRGKRTLVFCVTVAHAEAVAKQYIAAGYRACHAHGATDKEMRPEIIELLKSGDIEVVCNVGLYTDGLDVPELDCVQLLCPTKSLAKYLQMCGRVVRVHPNKDRAVILDHGGCVKAHGMPTDDREWSLAIGYKPPDGAPVVKNCPKCAMAVSGGAKTCPNCGYVWETKTPEEIKAEEGELKRLEKAHQKECITYLYGRYVMADNKNYQKTWCHHKFKDKFERWPTKREENQATKRFESELGRKPNFKPRPVRVHNAW